MNFQLTYKSKATPGVTNDTIKEILKSARRNNAVNKISGCLVFLENHFIQILEGDKELVKDLFETIKQDSRHSDIELLCWDDSDERLFNSWGMLYFDNQDLQSSDLSEEEFKLNLLLLETLSKPKSASEIKFWKAIKDLLITSGQITN